MHAPHNAEGTFPGFGESLISQDRPRGVVSENSRRSLDESAGLMAMVIVAGWLA
jgi:hypothetical protein